MQFDIIIIGGGMVGSSLALALKESCLKVALVDATPINETHDHRLIALNFPSVSFFKNLNIWAAMAEFANPIQKVHVSHRGHFGSTVLDASIIDLPFLGQVIPARYINNVLHQRLNYPELTIFRPALLQTLEETPENISIQINAAGKSVTLQTKWLIGADGTHSTVRKLLNISSEQKVYDQLAMVTVTQLTRSHENIAYERFLKRGAIAMLPLTQRRAATIWTDTTSEITNLLQLDDDKFLSVLQQNFGYRLGKFIQVAKRQTYPLQKIIAKTNTHPRVYLIGNAAHTLHPLAAQGLNIALQEVTALTNYVKNNLTLADLVLPTSHVRLQLSHYLNNTFSKNHLFFNFIRAAALVGLDSFKPGKKYFIEKNLES